MRLWWCAALVACTAASAVPNVVPTPSDEASLARSEDEAPLPTDAPPPDPPTTLRGAADAAGLPWPPPDLTIHVEKAARRLTVRSGDRALVTWPVALGGTNADKVRQGDRATPEGTFRVVTRNDRSQFHLFLGLSYPTTEDADRGLAGGAITAAQAARIREADAAGRVPPWNTALGGAIGIHGGGAGADWTLGCVAVENTQIEELWAVAPLGTKVVIDP